MKLFSPFALAPFAIISLLSTATLATPLVTQGGTAVAGQGLFTNTTGATTIDFNSGLSPTDGVAAYSLMSGAIVQGSQRNIYAAPVNDSSRYLTVNPTGNAVMTFNQQLSYFGFFASSLDCYNRIDLKSNDVTVLSLNGAQLSQLGGFSANGDQSKGLYINIYSSRPEEYFNKITFSSSNYAFETDNHAYKTATNATPEPATFLTIGAAFGALAIWRLSQKG